MEILYWIILGGGAGLIASILVGGPRGIFGDVVVGIVGAFLGGYIFTFFGQEGITGFNWYSLMVATIGAIIALWAVRLVIK